MKMKLLILLTGLGLMAAVSSASAYPLNDEYWGHNDHRWGDVIGAKSTFDTFGASASRSDSSLTVKIHTNFAGKAGVFGGLTGNGEGVGYGDLFLSPVWTPEGTAADHYINDNASNGTHWTYAFALDNPFASSGNGTLYALADAISGNNNPSALLAENFMSGGTFRDGQAVAVDTNHQGVQSVGTGSWMVGADFLKFTFATSGLNGFDPDHFALHWTMYCANDVIEGLDPTSVPAPNTVSLTLLGLGLLGLAYVRPRGRTPVRA